MRFIACAAIGHWFSDCHNTHVIKVLPKSDISIIWIDIWNIQSGSKAKSLINQYFNIERYIATIRGANINPRVLQCKNC